MWTCVPSGCPDIWWDDAGRPLRCCEEVVLWGETHRLSSGHAENTLQREETPIRSPENRPPDQLQAGRGAMGHPCPHSGTCDEFASYPRGVCPTDILKKALDNTWKKYFR